MVDSGFEIVQKHEWGKIWGRRGESPDTARATAVSEKLHLLAFKICLIRPLMAVCMPNKHIRGAQIRWDGWTRFAYSFVLCICTKRLVHRGSAERATSLAGSLATFNRDVWYRLIGRNRCAR